MLKAYASFENPSEPYVNLREYTSDVRYTKIRNLFVLYFEKEKDYFKFKLKNENGYEFITTSKIEAIERDKNFLYYFGIEEKSMNLTKIFILKTYQLRENK